MKHEKEVKDILNNLYDGELENKPSFDEKIQKKIEEELKKAIEERKSKLKEKHEMD